MLYGNRVVNAGQLSAKKAKNKCCKNENAKSYELALATQKTKLGMNVFKSKFKQHLSRRG